MFENSEQYTANKILILFILDRLGVKLSDHFLNAVLLGPGLVNYFSVQECREDLIAKGCVQRELDSAGTVLYSITEKGRERLGQMRYMLSGGLGARYEAYLEAIRDSLEQGMHVNADCFEDAAGNVYVRCYVREGSNCIVDVKLPVANRSDGAAICETWRKNTSELYLQLVKTFYDGIKTNKKEKEKGT